MAKKMSDRKLMENIAIDKAVHIVCAHERESASHNFWVMFCFLSVWILILIFASLVIYSNVNIGLSGAEWQCSEKVVDHYDCSCVKYYGYLAYEDINHVSDSIVDMNGLVCTDEKIVDCGFNGECKEKDIVWECDAVERCVKESLVRNVDS